MPDVGPAYPLLWHPTVVARPHDNDPVRSVSAGDRAFVVEPPKRIGLLTFS